MNTSTSTNDLQTKPSSPNIKLQKKRGKINIVACDKCKRDKKKCDGNYLTRKACKYCCNHNEICIYSEPNYLRITRILNAAAKNAAEEREDDPMQELQKQLTKYENTIIELAYQLENKNENEQSSKVVIEKLYLSLFANPQISNEQTFILKKLCEITNNSVNSNINGENIDKIRNKLLILASDDKTDIEKRHSWEELDKFVKMYNDNNLSYNIIIPSDDSNIFGFSYPSGSTTPIPSPQSIETSNANINVTNDHMTIIKKRDSKKFEPYPSGGRNAIRPLRRDSNVVVLHQNDPHEDIPIITVHASQNNHSTDSCQNSNVQFDNISSNENFPFSTSNLLLPSHMPYGFDKAGQYSNITSPTFSNNSTSDDNLEFPTFFSHPDLLGIFPFSQ